MYFPSLVLIIACFLYVVFVDARNGQVTYSPCTSLKQISYKVMVYTYNTCSSTVKWHGKKAGCKEMHMPLTVAMNSIYLQIFASL